MRSLKKKVAVALVALATAALVLSGCANAQPESFDATTVSCTDVASQTEAATTEVNSAKEAIDASKGTPGEATASTKLTAAEAKVTALNARAQSPECAQQKTPDGIPLAQCRTNAVIAYMKEQGFTDGQYVVGEERIDASKPEFSRQGSLGFRGEGTIPDTRAKLQESYNSEEPNEKMAFEAHVRQLSEFDPAVVKNAENWEIVQTTVDAVVSGNTGVNAGQQVAVGDTNSSAGDAAWLFVDPTTCTVPRTKVDAAGAPVDPSTPLADQPVAAHRPGCKNPTGGFKPIPPAPTPQTPETPTPEGPNPKNIEEAPQRQGNLPEQQMPNPLPAEPEHYQPSEPVNPPDVYVPPAEEPKPAPGGGGEPAPQPEPEPIVIPDPVEPAPAPSDPGQNTGCAPGRPSC